MERISSFVGRYISPMSIPRITWTDIVEILIISFLVYHILVWIKNTKAWSLLRGLIVIGVFIFLAYVFRMNTILWIVKNASVVAITAMIVVFQPELRKALDMLGRKNIFSSLIPFDSNRNLDERFSDKTVGEIVKACYEMGKVKTGALIVIAQNDPLTEYERTGIELDSLVSSQLLINIFEHNTPLHDGAIIIQGNRVVSATCYLPLSDNMALSKELGTRHRAGVGISEVTDSITIIVSEETGRVSVAYEGELYRNIDADFLKERLGGAQNKTIEERRFRLWKGRSKNEKETNK
ncbi:TIGR00159 family protein [bacterium C-53]|nr:TIGR00159 family protein [Lachnospiraceae bacterium]NBI01646.1 TIGR00159 family protein [Lachnospiraceae bacterium]RKJ12940.1 TIGR00159 family protein [bacterium C-53]